MNIILLVSVNQSQYKKTKELKEINNTKREKEIMGTKREVNGEKVKTVNQLKEDVIHP